MVALTALGLLAGLMFAPAASAATGDFVITGRGYGQGQGMSQWGAWQGARLGNTYQQILAFYYPGTTLSSLASVARPSRQTITVRITTSVDVFTQVKLTAAATSATLFDAAGNPISSLSAGDAVSLLNSGGKVQVGGSSSLYDYVDLKPDSADGRVTVLPTPNWSTGTGDRSYWGFIRVKPASGGVLVHNIVPIDKYVAGVAEINPDWARPSSTAYYAPEAVKAQAVAARTFIAAHTGSIPYDDTRDINYVGYDYEVVVPGMTQAAEDTAGVVITYGGKLISTHFSSCSGGYTTNSAWSDTNSLPYEPAQPDPWSLAAPPTLPGYAWKYTISPAGLASKLSSKLNVGTITQVEVIQRDTEDADSHARYLRVTGSSGNATISARTFKSLLGLKSTLILSIVTDGSLNRYEQSHSYPAYTGTWTATSASGASGGSFRYTNRAGSVTVSFNGTYLAWLAKRSPVYGKAKVTLDGQDKGTVDLYSPTTLFQSVWNTGTLANGTHTVTISWTGTKNSAATATNISVDAFDILGTMVTAPAGTRHEQTASALDYTGAWATFSTSKASAGGYARANTKGASVTATFDGTYLAWIATKGTTLGKALVSLDGGAAKSVNLAASVVAYQQRVWTTGILSPGKHTVKIWWDPSNIAGKYISVDAFDVVGELE